MTDSSSNQSTAMASTVKRVFANRLRPVCDCQWITRCITWKNMVWFSFPENTSGTSVEAPVWWRHVIYDQWFCGEKLRLTREPPCLLAQVHYFKIKVCNVTQRRSSLWRCTEPFWSFDCAVTESASLVSQLNLCGKCWELMDLCLVQSNVLSIWQEKWSDVGTIVNFTLRNGPVETTMKWKVYFPL